MQKNTATEVDTARLSRGEETAAPWAVKPANEVQRIIRDYWRKEARHNTWELARLRGICQMRGYNYEATRAALIRTVETNEC